MTTLCAQSQSASLLGNMGELMYMRPNINEPEALKKNTLRLQEIVQGLKPYETNLELDEQESLYKAKAALYNDWLLSSNFKGYDQKELKSTLIKYFGKKYTWSQSLDVMVEDALGCISTNLVFNKKISPEEVTIRATIFPYYVERLEKKSGADFYLAVYNTAFLQTSIFYDLKSTGIAGVDIEALIDYSDRFLKIIELGAAPTGSHSSNCIELEVVSKEFVQKVSAVKEQFESCKISKCK